MTKKMNKHNEQLKERMRVLQEQVHFMAEAPLPVDFRM